MRSSKISVIRFLKTSDISGGKDMDLGSLEQDEQYVQFCYSY